MRVSAYADAGAFLLVAGPLLMRAEAVNCLGLGIVSSLVSDPGRYPKAHLLSVEDPSGLHGVAWMTPPWPLGLSPMPRAAVASLVEHVATLEDRVSGVVGPKPAVDEFKELWLSREHRLQSTVEQRIYSLERVSPPRSVPGALRIATEGDRECVMEWSRCFVQECGITDSPEAVRQHVRASLANGSRVLWESEGEAVSMAAFGGRTPSGVRINWVYTPPEHRRHGYASAVVAALSQKLLDQGRKFCFLYTDLANPTSNSIYQTIGYSPVCDSAHHTFGD